MLKIRLQRIGRKNDPAFRAVLTDSKNSTKSGRFLEILGTYNPKMGEKNLNADRIKYWLSVGAQASPTVHNLLVDEKIIEGKKVKTPGSKNKKDEEQKSAGEPKAAEQKPKKEGKVEVAPGASVEQAQIETVKSEEVKTSKAES